MIDLTKKFRGSGYLIVESDTDTTNIVCRHGHIYADGDSLVASLLNGTRAECIALRRLGQVVHDGDSGELSVRFPAARFNEVAAILKPRQANAVARAA